MYRATSLPIHLNPSFLKSRYWQHYAIGYPPVGRCVGCLLQRVGGWCQIYFCFIFQASRINVEALVTSALLRCSILHTAANWHCRQVHFPFLYLAITLFICLLTFWALFCFLHFSGSKDLCTLIGIPESMKAKACWVWRKPQRGIFRQCNELHFPLFPLKLMEICAERSLYCFGNTIFLSVICFISFISCSLSL